MKLPGNLIYFYLQDFAVLLKYWGNMRMQHNIWYNTNLRAIKCFSNKIKLLAQSQIWQQKSNGLFLLSDVNLCWYSLRLNKSMHTYVFIWNYNIAQEMIFYIILIRRKKRCPFQILNHSSESSTIYKVLYRSKGRIYNKDFYLCRYLCTPDKRQRPFFTWCIFSSYTHNF